MTPRFASLAFLALVLFSTPYANSMTDDELVLFIPVMIASQPDPVAPPSGTGKLPDTGLTKCYNATAEIECPAEGQPYHGQDAQYPRSRSYTFNAGGTVTDNVTELEWQRNPEEERFYWQNAVRYCAGLELGEKVDWRLPTVKELLLITDLQRINPSIDPTFSESDLDSNNYWTSTELAENTDRAWYVEFYAGSVFTNFKYQLFHVRCVRAD